MKGAVVLFMRDLKGAWTQADFQGVGRDGLLRFVEMLQTREVGERTETFYVNGIVEDSQGLRTKWRPLKHKKERLSMSFAMSRLLKMFMRADFGTFEIKETFALSARAVLI